MQPPAYSSLLENKILLRGAALPDPDHPFLISPLPQFTTPLTPSNNFSYTPVPPLPELTDDIEGDEDEASDSEPEHEATTPIVVQQDLQSSNGFRRLSFLQTDGRSEALARTGPYLDHRRARSGSTPEMYTSPSVNISADTSNASPRSPPKSATFPQSQQIQQQYASSSREGDVSSFLTRSKTRLHDLLRDSAISTSLPNMSASHFPTSFTSRETLSGRVSPPRSRSDSLSNTNNNKTPLPSSSSSSTSSDTAALPLPPPQTGTGKPITGIAPRQGFSSASTEAKKLEEERRRKLEEEKQRQNSPSTGTSTSTTQTPNNNNYSSSVQLTPRREQQPSSNATTTGTMVSSNSGPIPSSTWRGQSFTGSLGRSGPSIVSPTGSKEDQQQQFDTVSNSGSTTARRGQSYTGSLGRSGSSIVSPSKEEQHQHDSFITHQARYHVGSIGKARGPTPILSSSVDPAGIYA